jgi:hypothetical protein
VDLSTILRRLETYSILGKAIGRVYETLEPFEIKIPQRSSRADEASGRRVHRKLTWSLGKASVSTPSLRHSGPIITGA